MPDSKTIKALRKAVKDNPLDLDCRLVLADALEDDGGLNDATFQRTIVAFARVVEEAVNRRGPMTPKVHVGVTEGRINARVFINTRWRNDSVGQTTVYAWVERFIGIPLAGENLGGVYRGSWKKPEGPMRFWLTDHPSVWKENCEPYGLRYLK